MTANVSIAVREDLMKFAIERAQSDFLTVHFDTVPDINGITERAKIYYKLLISNEKDL